VSLFSLSIPRLDAVPVLPGAQGSGGAVALSRPVLRRWAGRVVALP